MWKKNYVLTLCACSHWYWLQYRLSACTMRLTLLQQKIWTWKDNLNTCTCVWFVTLRFRIAYSTITQFWHTDTKSNGFAQYIHSRIYLTFSHLQAAMYSKYYNKAFIFFCNVHMHIKECYAPVCYILKDKPNHKSFTDYRRSSNVYMDQYNSKIIVPINKMHI